ncbi:YihY/virulence factor BrkB family protein [Poseidonocella sp. HB161398]|uniref:YihY/virulence factor BrkB family protein n=1 Tax=Poseidonocella sp. HB161398 TaxID=2320855 RepID=UPI0011088F31|nr:YihY/virulence factor BrkB family protein [Poseidonocella sp. HB161398]
MLNAIKIAWRFIANMQARIDEANLPLVAAGGAFFAMLSVFPAIAAVVALMGFIADPKVVEEQMLLLQDFIPPDAFSILNSQVHRMILTSNSTLGWATTISTLAALWSARKGTDALIRGLNAVHHGPARAGWHAMALSFAMTLALSVVAVVAILALVVVPIISTILNLPFFAENLPPTLLSWVNGVLLQIARWGISLGLVFTGVWLLYRFAPNVKDRMKGYFTPGSVLSILVWGAATFGFSYYLANFANYSQVYGSIGAVVALLMFLYITIYVVLLGAALNAELVRYHRIRQEKAEAEAYIESEPEDEEEVEAREAPAAGA